MSLSESEIKSKLRIKYKCIRSNFIGNIDKKSTDEGICRHIINSSFFSDCDTIFLYSAIGSEIDLASLHTAAIKHGKKVAYPRVESKGEIKFYYVDEYKSMVAGAYGIREPSSDSECVCLSPSATRLVIVPALCYSFDGGRLGYGGGYYDRFLACFNGVSLGVCYSDCVASELITERHDVYVNHIVTQDGFIK